MSKIGNFRRLPNCDLERLLAEPELVTGYLYNEDDYQDEEGFGPFADLDVDKAWHGIHFLLTGSAWGNDPPECFIVAGGREIGDVEVGYGPVRGFASTEVKQIAEILVAADEAKLRSRFDPHVMTRDEVYPAHLWKAPPQEHDVLGYLINYYKKLREFIMNAAQADEALLVYFN